MRLQSYTIHIDWHDVGAYARHDEYILTMRKDYESDERAKEVTRSIIRGDTAIRRVTLIRGDTVICEHLRAIPFEYEFRTAYPER